VVNYLEKLLCVEVLEKISRMQRFLRLEPAVSYHQDTEVINIFLKALDAVLDNLRPVIVILSEEVPLDEWERITTARRLSDIFDSVNRLHVQLQFIYGRWVRPETHVFIKSVLEFIPSNRRPEKVNVILSNMYSFLETDLSSYIEDVLSPTIRMDIQNQSPSVFLPKIERDNPLNWAILIHECGHIDSQGISNLLEQPETIPAQIDTPPIEILQRWVEEIYCDVFAARILGPAYLASFATFALVVAECGASEIATNTHPPDIVRISIIQEVLKKSNLEVTLTEPRLNSTDVSSLFYNVLEERTKLVRDKLPPLRQPQLQLQLGDFVDVICEQVDQIISLSRHLTVEDFTRISELAKRLSEGIPIGSYQNPPLIESAKKKFLKGRIASEELDEAKSAVQESRVLLWEVVNAGWLHKIESIYPKAFTLFFRADDTPIEKKVTSWGEELEEIDRLLLKSIESSEIQKLMEEV
jgi:hypothetical protein